MSRTFTKIMMFYVAITTMLLVSMNGITAQAQSASPLSVESGGWLADIIITGVNLFIKLILALV